MILVRIHTTFHEDWYRRSNNIKVLTQQNDRLKCRYYWWEGSMKYAIHIAVGDMINIPSFIKTGSGVKKLFGGDTYTHVQTHTNSESISLSYFNSLKIMKVGCKIKYTRVNPPAQILFSSSIR
jgi:hypothetical protein